MKEFGVWIEITTLIIPTLNDSEENLTNIAKFIANELGVETPWHVTKFSGIISWKLKHISNTSANTLRQAHNIGRAAGLRYIYSGNIPGMDTENTYCPSCEVLIIERSDMHIKRLDCDGKYSNCGQNLDIIG